MHSLGYLLVGTTTLWHPSPKAWLDTVTSQNDTSVAGRNSIMYSIVNVVWECLSAHPKPRATGMQRRHKLPTVDTSGSPLQTNIPRLGYGLPPFTVTLVTPGAEARASLTHMSTHQHWPEDGSAVTDYDTPLYGRDTALTEVTID
ncbi:hypothetical protein D9611_001021 [Ephemerocybe angulata]|uniref:Uncharacterized protein n=1 Tax=Ephemerocybe angulata TaxID=980116 RepID=A0A8H5BQ14_9AGAR|nr:hypothetical protein D9611_001021 [Tulosesus angulatus]